MKIIVLASYRTGSTAFCNALANLYKLENYDEYFHSLPVHANLSKFDIIKSTDYVIKIMPNQIIEPYFTELINSSTVYGIYRTDIIKQIASFVVTQLRNTIWHNIKNSDNEKYEIPIDLENIRRISKEIMDYNNDYEEKLKPLCHKEFIYENIQPLLKVSEYTVYNKPINYQELIDAITTILNTKRK